MTTSYRGTPAEIYDRCFVPALFRQWGGVVADAAGVGRGMQVLDVACGTGALACCARERVGPEGAVVGLDINPEMLEVARAKRVEIEWREGAAERLPFESDRFDAVVSQFGFMFFDDRALALREMMRVLKPGGTLGVAVCDALDHSPGYAVLAELLHRLFGQAVAEAFRAPFDCGDPERLLQDCDRAELTQRNHTTRRVVRHEGRVRFASIADLVATERACAWTLGGLLDEAQFLRLAEAAEESLRPFVNADGGVEFSMPVLLLLVVKDRASGLT